MHWADNLHLVNSNLAKTLVNILGKSEMVALHTLDDLIWNYPLTKTYKLIKLTEVNALFWLLLIILPKKQENTW